MADVRTDEALARPRDVVAALSAPRRGWLARREALYGFAFISPWLFGLLAFTAGPLLAVFYLSFTEYPILSEPTWVGLQNYEQIFTNDDQFGTSLVNTAVYVGIRVPLHLTLAFALALMLNRTIRGIGFFRTAIYLPSMIPIVAMSVIWRILLDPRVGYVNYFGGLLGLPEINWLTSESWVKPVIVFVSLWHVGIPMMTPVILYNVIIDIINSFQVFAYAFIMTRGGPNDATLFYVLYIYRQAFQFFQMGYAAALSVILLVVVLILTVILLRSSNRWVHYERI